MRFDPRIVSIPHPRTVTQHIPSRAKIRETFSGASGALLALWLLSSFLAVIIPVCKWAKERNSYYRYYGKYIEYEWKQRQYEQMQNGNYNNGGYGSYYCSWWNFRCRQRMANYQWYMQGQQGGGGQNGGNMMRMPSWYTFFGGRVEEDDREREEMNMGNGSNGAMKFVYAWNILMFLGLTTHGWRVLANGKDATVLIVALMIYGQFSLMNLITTVQGAIETDNRFLENSVYGWFGQYSVLVAYTDFWMFIHSMIFVVVLGVMQCCSRRKGDVEESNANYQNETDAVMVQRMEDMDYVHA